MTHRVNTYMPMVLGSAMTLMLALIIGMLTLTPLTVSGPPGSDKVYHTLAFASLAFPLPLIRPKMALWVVGAVLAYGGSIELIQPFFGRHAEWSDLLADGLGAVFGAGAGYFLSHLSVTHWIRDGT